MNRRDAETQSFNAITEQVMGACIGIHKHLGPGLLESAYEECVCYELAQLGMRFERQKPLPVHEAQLLTYLKLSGLTLGLLINFNVAVLKHGIKRIANNFIDISAPPRLRGGLKEFRL
jgi:PD-(D/E)XK nuclease superfamily